MHLSGEGTARARDSSVISSHSLYRHFSLTVFADSTILCHGRRVWGIADNTGGKYYRVKLCIEFLVRELTNLTMIKYPVRTEQFWPWDRLMS